MIRFLTRKYLVVAAVIGLLIFLHTIKVLAPVESFMINIFNLPLKGLYSLGSFAHSIYDQRADKADLISRTKQLEDTVNQLSADNAKLKVLEEENQFLRQQLKFLSTNKYLHYVLANIVSRGELIDSANNNQTILIDKGSKDGLFSGLAVMSPSLYATSTQGIVVGKVIEVKEHLAEVYLTTSPNCKFAASLLNQNKTSGIVRGDMGLTMKMEFIPQTDQAKKSDLVITSGLEQNIPRGLVIGKITGVTKENNDLWQNATIETLVDLDKLSIVSVLLPN